ncbi:MAG TPA: SEL1-like repeat protein [Propylenella sp.]|nr:SEL1-like repeat protein [Propylenella sp.]
MKRSFVSALLVAALLTSASAQQPDAGPGDTAVHDQPPTSSTPAEPIGASPDASLTAAQTGQRLPTPLDAEIAYRIDKGLTAAGEASAIPADYAFGAFQRGYFLTAFALALERAKGGDAAAQTLLGELLSRGLGVKQDLAAAADWYGLAAAQGEAEAIYALGRLYLDGRGVSQDVSRAADLLEKAAKQGHPVAAREFAYLLLQGKGRERNALLGAAFLRRAAGLGDMDAQFALGGLYVEGVGVVRNDTQAARWYGEAARNGHVGAEVEYAIMLFNGRGVNKDEAVAAHWFRKAAGADNPLAQVRLARLYAEGRGVDKNPAEAARWYVIARSRGVENPAMEDWLKRLDGPTLNEAVAAAEEWSRMRQVSRRVAAAPPSTAPSAAPMDNSPE